MYAETWNSQDIVQGPAKEGGRSLAIGDPGLVVAPALQVLKVDTAKHVCGRGHVHYPGRPAQHSRQYVQRFTCRWRMTTQER